MKPLFLFFFLWSILLTGLFYSYFGPPGVIQALQLQALLYEKRKHLVQIQKENAILEKKIKNFQTYSSAKEKEIRNLLNYASKDELIFYFQKSQHQ